LFPGSILGFFIYGDLKIQPQITPDFVVSTNHVYAFLLTSLLGVLTFFRTRRLKVLFMYLFFLSIVLEVFHLFIPERSFQLADLFGNVFGVILVIIINYCLKKYENYKS
tara:strand:- start:44 stop:370 length:327 start_codon:yes stop_codon:yes gene_type:complete